MLALLGEGEKENLPIPKTKFMPCSVGYMKILSHIPENPSVRLRRKTLQRFPHCFVSSSYFPSEKEIELFVCIFFCGNKTEGSGFIFLVEFRICMGLNCF